MASSETFFAALRATLMYSLREIFRERYCELLPVEIQYELLYKRLLPGDHLVATPGAMLLAYWHAYQISYYFG